MDKMSDQSKVESANLEINKKFYGEDRDGPNIARWMNGNQIALVTSGDERKSQLEKDLEENQ